MGPTTYIFNICVFVTGGYLVNKHRRKDVRVTELAVNVGSVRLNAKKPDGACLGHCDIALGRR
jgi:hypothetical protein